MSLEESTLIDLIEKFPHLWDKKDSNFKDKLAVENSWNTISQIMSLTVEECQEMWQSIRLKFIRERRLLKNIPSGSGAYSCKWPLFEKLGFLQAVIGTRKTKGNIRKSEGKLSTPSEIWDENIIDGEESLSQDILETEGMMMDTQQVGSQAELLQEKLVDVTNTPSTSQTNRRKDSLREIHNPRREKLLGKRKVNVPLEQLVETCSSVGNSLNSFLKSPPTESSIPKEDYYFGLSIAETVSKIKNDKKKVLVKAEIFGLLAEAVE